MAKSELKGLKDKSGKLRKTEAKAEEKTGFGHKVKGVRDKLKLGQHHKMERFTVILSATMAFLLFFTAMSFAGYRSDVSTQVSAQSLISKEFTFSLSGQRGSVEGVFGDEGRTDVMVLFKLRDFSGMSANAENYELFVTGHKDSLKYEPDTTFALFGTTGYGMIRFQHAEGLKNEPLNVTIRANSELTTPKKGSNTELGDGSFANFDQARFFVNPGADVVLSTSALAPGETDPAKLYTSLVAERADAEIRKEITASVESLGNLLKKTDEYENRLISTGYKPPARPWFVEGDYVDEEGVFHAATYVSKSHKLNYVDYSIWDGYVNQVTDSLSGFTAYMADVSGKGDTPAEVKEDELRERQDTIETVETDDGTILELRRIVTGTNSSSQVAAKGSVESLQSTWRTYLTTKSKLQRDMMARLLVLDADVLSQPSMYSEHTGDSVVTYY